MLLSIRNAKCFPIFMIWMVYASSVVSDEYNGPDKLLEVFMPGVVPEKDDTYLNTAKIVSDDDKTYFITTFEPRASMKVVHHIIARGCDDAAEPEPGKAICNGNSKILYAWARGAPILNLPKGVGFKVGRNTDVKFIVLQVHYANASAVQADTGDHSGIVIHLTSMPLKKEAGVLLMSTGGRMLPNTKERYEVACKIRDDVTFHPFAFRTHTHQHGLLVSGYKIGQNHGEENNIQLIGQKNPLLPQFFYPVKNKDISITKGDILAASCIMKNDENRTVYIGGTSNDEMCNFYIMYYVEGSRHPISGCGSFGPPNYYWSTDPLMNTISIPVPK